MNDLVMLFGRILMSVLFIEAGYSELVHLDGTIKYFEALGLPLPWLTVWGVLAVELIGGLALLVGFRTRIAALMLGLFAIAAGAIGHSNIAVLTQFQMLMKDIAIGGGLFYVAVQGAGALSVDAWLGSRQAVKRPA